MTAVVNNPKDISKEIKKIPAKWLVTDGQDSDDYGESSDEE